MLARLICNAAGGRRGPPLRILSDVKFKTVGDDAHIVPLYNVQVSRDDVGIVPYKIQYRLIIICRDRPLDCPRMLNACRNGSS